MLTNEFKEKSRDIGLLVENIICMADCYEEPIEKFRQSMFYKPEFEDKEKIIEDMIHTCDRIQNEVKLLSIDDLRVLYDGYGIAMLDYTDMLGEALRKEPYSNNEVKFKCDALISIVLDMVHRDMRQDDVYKKIAGGEINENVQIQLLS